MCDGIDEECERIDIIFSQLLSHKINLMTIMKVKTEKLGLDTYI